MAYERQQLEQLKIMQNKQSIEEYIIPITHQIDEKQQLEQLKKQQLWLEDKWKGYYKNKQSMVTERAAYIRTYREQLLKVQKEELEKRIQENKTKERLKKIGKLSYLKSLNDYSNKFIETSGDKAKYLEVRTKRIIIFSTQQKFEALYEIIKKQDERIKELEIILKK